MRRGTVEPTCVVARTSRGSDWSPSVALVPKQSVFADSPPAAGDLVELGAEQLDVDVTAGDRGTDRARQLGARLAPRGMPPHRRPL